MDSDDESELHINGKKVSTDKAGTSSSPGDIQLSKGEHKFEVFYKQGLHDRHLNLYVESSKLPKIKVPSSWYSIDGGKNTAPKINSNTEGSITYWYYEDVKSLKEMRETKPIEQGKTSKLMHYRKDRREFYGYFFDGDMSIPEDGDYTFHIEADDEAWLGIENNSVNVTYDKKKSIKLKLKKGKAKLKLSYLQKAGGTALKLLVESKNIKLMEVPQSWFDSKTNSQTKESSADLTKTPTRKRVSRKKGQLRYNYYEGKWQGSLEDIITQPVKSSGIEPDLNSKKGRNDNHYGLYYYGYLNNLNRGRIYILCYRR